MTTALYKYILKKNCYVDEIRDLIVYDDLVNHLISKGVIDEKDYMNIWKSKGNKIDAVFKALKEKSVNDLKECFDILKFLYGSMFEDKLKKFKQDLIDSIHQKGGFPKINTYIPRTEQEKKIKDKLANVRWYNSLVVFGRVGEGKSYLVCECLKDIDLIKDEFNNRLYWINVGECENGSNILQPLTRLLRMIAPKKRKLYDLDELIEELAEIFASEKHQNSLVILDNARSLKVIEIFQKIRCKLIIITHFKNVKNAEFVEVDLGFTINETISLFAKYLNTSTESLNNLHFDDVKDLHELCKGHPTTLSLLAVFLSCKRDHALASKYLWNHIKEKINNGEIEDLGNDVDIIHTNFYKALRMCIDTIDTEEMKQFYYQLAIFPKDANIYTDVLEVFWNKKPEEVWNIMLHFENRSLINSIYNTNKKVYIYAIHDLFLYYLKNETKAHRKEFHKKLIESYESRYEYYNLPDDNYILLFLGYHLKQAEMFDRFQKFLDLKFIEHKIRIVGVNNMEQDLRTYKEEIIGGNADLKMKWENCMKFFRDNKNELRQMEKTDIIQLALPTLIDDAHTLMDRNKANSINKLYFTMKLSAGRLKSSYEFIMKEVVTAMAYCFDSNVPKLLIGLENGDIMLYCPQTSKEFERFQSHKKMVFNLKVSSDNSCFLSVSEDRTVKLWQFFSQRLSLDGLKDVVTSPKCIQNEYFDAFSPGKKHNFKEFVYNEDGAYLISANFSNKYSETKLICTGANNGKVIIWHASTREKLCVTTETGFPANNVYFSNDDSKIYFTKQEKIQIYQLDNRELKLSYLDSITNKEDIDKLYVTDENTLIAIGQRYVMMYKFPYEDDSNAIILHESEDNIVCSSMANDEYLAIGIKENVFLFSIINRNLVDTLKHKKVVTSMAMDILKDDDDITSMIFMKFDNNHIQQCNIMMPYYEQPRNEQNLLTTYWKNHVPLLAQVLNDNVLKIQHEFTTINQIEKPHRITFITFSLCGNNIIYALENGVIIEYPYKIRDCYKTLATLEKTVNYLQCIKLESLTDHPEISYNSSESHNGAIVVVTDGDTKVHILLEGGCIKGFSWEFDIFQVFPMGSNRLLCIDVSGGVFIIFIEKKSGDIKLVNYATWDRKVCSSAFCLKRNLVAVMFTEKVHKTNYLEIRSITTGETMLTKLLSGFTPTCCAFSFSGELLVVGSNDGRIMVVNLQNNNECKILNASNFPIQFVQFSKSVLPILVVIGREVSWWNLESFGNAYTNENDSLSNTQFDFDFWKNKTVHHEVSNLLQTVSLYSNAIHFSVSENFETFLVVDDESRIYVIKCIK
ncbi:uncharacterized protein LOC123321310 [Coccinella septempunctata]|uniref:uncharacterized protein LOC123321310 n=1 Tax=Coccinella septempunctata TaxID=41139 RepID=UPI001D08381E|nr:uncharacterized protein LOC123321310 [Coccinella septempunctata]